jgi:uncharacterized protein
VKQPTASRPSQASRLSRWLLLLGGAYLVILSLAKLFENPLVFRGMTAEQGWHAAPTPRFEDLDFTTADGQTVHAWWLPPENPDTQCTVLYCHGNGLNLSYRSEMMLTLQAHLKCGVLQFDYPGYGKSTGEVNEASCYAAAEAAHSWLKQTWAIPAEQIVLFGESLGGGVATELARRYSCKTLVLHCTYTTLPAAAKVRFWFLPCETLMSNRFETVKKLGQLECPVFICHGTADRTIPYTQAEENFRAAQEPKQFVRRDGMGHTDPLEPEVLRALAEFVRSAVPIKREP